MTAGFASTSDARKRLAENATTAIANAAHGTVTVGHSQHPALRLASGEVICDGVPAPPFVALSFKEKP